VARQHPGEENRKGSPATPAATAIGTKHPLPSLDLTLNGLRIVASQPAVAIERARPLAERAGLGLERAKKLLKCLLILYKDGVRLAFHFGRDLAGQNRATSRNTPCPFGSGRKYKKCCLGKEEPRTGASADGAGKRQDTDLDGLSHQVNDLIRQGKWPEAERLCPRLREQFPDEIDAADRLAQLHQAQEHYDKALPYAQAALERARRHPEKFHPELVADLEEQVAFIRSKAVP
jgi:hypothetical protein